MIIDTAADQIRGGPGGIETTVQTVINGVIDVRNMTVETGGTLLFGGPNTVTILASGYVVINGLVSANGGDNPGVKTLNTTNQPEPGAPGGAGGGTGGTGFVPDRAIDPAWWSGRRRVPARRASAAAAARPRTPRAASTSAAAAAGVAVASARTRGTSRPGGEFVRCQTLIGFDAEPGFPGGAGGTGAVSQTARARAV